jgi:hypothetical protein
MKAPMIVLILISSAMVCPYVHAADAPPDPQYPHVNPAPSYDVDAAWPAKPPDFKWGTVPGVTIDAEGNIWLYTRSAPAVQVYAPDGRYLFGWGDTTGSHQIKIDRDGYVWTANTTDHVVRKHERDGTVVMTLGVEGEAGVDERHFFKPTDMAFASNGDIFVSDGYGNARIVQFDKDGKYIKAWGALGTTDGTFSLPHAIAIDSKDRIYLADRNNARVQVYNSDGGLIDSWKHILVPWGIWITGKDEIWICGSSPMPWAEKPGGVLGCPPKDQLIMKFNTDGKLLELFTFPKGIDGQEKPGELNWVHGIAIDSQGNLFLGDIIGQRLQKFLRRQ